MHQNQELSGKSLEFVKKRIDSGECGDMKNNHYSSMREVCFTDIASQKLNTDIVDRKSDSEWKLKLYAKSECGDKKQVNIEVQYNPNTDFDYFTMKSCRCDGTLIFYFELCEKILENVFLGNTQYKPKLPENYENDMDKYIIKYVVGDFVFANEFGEEFATEDKPWMLSRFSVMLPIKCDFVKKAEGQVNV